MDNAKPTRNDFELLLARYLDAMDSLPGVMEGPGGPIYTDEINSFFKYIKMSVWFSGGYDEIDYGNRRTWSEVLRGASFKDLGNVLHNMVRQEHWDPGAWEDYLKQGSMKLVIDHADFLTSNQGPPA